jgi:hypothetical protein
VLGEAKDVDGTMYARLGGLDRLALIMDGARRAREVEDAVHLDVLRLQDQRLRSIEAGPARNQNPLRRHMVLSNGLVGRAQATISRLRH